MERPILSDDEQNEIIAMVNQTGAAHGFELVGARYSQDGDQLFLEICTQAASGS